MLDQLFSLQTQWYEAAMVDVHAGHKWRRILEVPATSRHWAHRLMPVSAAGPSARGGFEAQLQNSLHSATTVSSPGREHNTFSAGIASADSRAPLLVALVAHPALCGRVAWPRT